MSHPYNDDAQPTAPRPPEPADVDALLSESLKAQTEQDFAWKEPERKPRWWERAEAQSTSGEAMTAATSSQVQASSPASSSHSGDFRMGSAIFALVALVLAAWVVFSVVFGFTIDPLMVGLVVCTLAGLALVGAGLRPRRGRRI